MGFSKDVKQVTRTVVEMYKMVGDEDKIGKDIFYKDIADHLSVNVRDIKKIVKFVKF